MAALQKSEISFRRSGSSGLVWDDKLLSGELKPSKPKEEDGAGEPRSEPQPYKTIEVEPTFDPPSPKVSGCVCNIFGKPAKKGQTQTQKKNKKGGVKRKSHS